MSASRVLLLGEGDLADEVRAALDALDADVVRLMRPTQREVAEAFAHGPVGRAVVVSRDDAFVLRAALMVRDADEDVELLLTYFDPATAPELEQRIGNCRLTSMADVVAPVLAGPCLDESLGAVQVRDNRPAGLRTDGERLEEVAVDVPDQRRLRALVRAVVRPHDRSAALLLYGALGLVGVLVVRDAGVRDRAAAGDRGRLLRRDEDARHRRPERQGRRRPDVVQARDRGRDARRAGLRGVLHGGDRQPPGRPPPDRVDGTPGGAAARPRRGRRARPARPAALPAAARLRGAGGRRRRPRGRRERRPGARGGPAGRDRPRRRPLAAAAAVARAARPRSRP